jgi:ABC-type sugar transport system permease subunit
MIMQRNPTNQKTGRPAKVLTIHPWRGLTRALVVVPWALPSVIIGLMWSWDEYPLCGHP